MLRRESRDAAALRLFCLPYAAGGATAYRSWPARLPSWVDVCPVQLPGRESRAGEPPFTRFDELVPELAGGLEPWLELPFALFGHSLGAGLAFELCRWWRRRGRPLPRLLCVSGSAAPQMYERRTKLSHLTDGELVRELRRYQGTPDEVLDSEELLLLVMPVLRADFELLDTYRHVEEPPLDCPIVAFAGAADHDVSATEVEAWRVHAARRFTVRTFPGGHFFVHSHEAEVLAALEWELEAIRPTDAAPR